jgi:two-component system, OmpR family, sensor histidine kinase VicK
MPHNISPQEFINRTRWYIFIRWFLLLAIIVPGILSLYIINGWAPIVARDGMLGIIAVLSNGIFYYLSLKIISIDGYKKLATTLLIIDVLIVSIFIFINGGIESRNPILYTVPIIISSMLFGRAALYKTAGAAIVMYNTIIIGAYFGLFQTIGAFESYEEVWRDFTLTSVIFFTSILLMIAWVVDYITRLLIEKQQEASDNLAVLNEAQTIAKLGSWEWDVTRDKLTWSDELFNLFGKKRNKHELKYNDFINVIHPEDRQNVINEVEKILKKGKIFAYDFRAIHSNGSLRYMRSHGHVVRDNTKKPIKVIGIAQDITKVISLEKTRQEFVSLVSHQLRTPATGVKQYIAIILDGHVGEISPQQRTFLQVAYENNETQIAIINDLLNVAQVDSGNIKLVRKPIDLVSVVQSIIKEQAVNFEIKKQTATLSSRFKSLPAQADEQKLYMALSNIIENAHKYTQKGGKININITKLKNKFTITITDNGPGIAKKDKIKIFRKFARVNIDNTYIESGTGLGLYISNEIIKLHGGKITVESVIGKGAKFKIELPG